MLDHLLNPDEPSEIDLCIDAVVEEFHSHYSVYIDSAPTEEEYFGGVYKEVDVTMGCLTVTLLLSASATKWVFHAVKDFAVDDGV
jgi:hypothetical protein